MSDNDDKPIERQPGICPFLGQTCIKERCELYIQLRVSRPGQLAGTIETRRSAGCIFQHLVELMAVQSVPGRPAPGPGPN